MRIEQKESIELLLTTKGLLQQGWVQGMPACDQWGQKCEPGSNQAVAWCFSGAVQKASMILRFSLTLYGRGAINRVLDPINYRKEIYSISTWQDDACRTLNDLMELIDDEIARWESGQRLIPQSRSKKR